MQRLKVKEDYNLDKLQYYGFRKQDYLVEGGHKEKTGCNVWRIDDVYDEFDFVVYYGITIFEKIPKTGYYAPYYEGDCYCAKPRMVYMMADDCSYMEHTSFEFNPKIYDLIVDGVLEKVEEGE